MDIKFIRFTSHNNYVYALRCTQYTIYCIYDFDGNRLTIFIYQCNCVQCHQSFEFGHTHYDASFISSNDGAKANHSRAFSFSPLSNARRAHIYLIFTNIYCIVYIHLDNIKSIKNILIPFQYDVIQKKN